VKRGRHVAVPEGPRDLGLLWEAATRLEGDSLPAWLSAKDGAGYRRVGSVSLAGLSVAEQRAAEEEFEELELARLIVEIDPHDEHLRHVYVAAPRSEQVWSIGVFTGASPWSLTDRSRDNPLLTAAQVTDVPAASVADPFVINHAGRWYMLFEVVNWRTWKGEIGLATSIDGLAWQYERIVLAEPFHLSYPYVFEADGHIYMIPETSQAESVRLYRARRFPWDWEHAGDLLSGLPFADSSVILHGGRWWLFTETSGGRNSTLRLYHADGLFGPWHEHPQSPIVDGDATSARPAGRIISADERLVRFAQNCVPAYGTDVRAFEITRLTPETYSERPLGAAPILGPRGTGWNAGGMHHVDPVRLPDGGWLAAVDGWHWEPEPDGLPAQVLLLAALRPLFSEHLPPDNVFRIVSRRPNEYASSSKTEIVTLELPSGSIRELFVKYGRMESDPAPRCRHGIEYCAAVQQHLVARLPLPHIKQLGLVQVGEPPVPALVCDFLAGSLRVGEAPDDSGIVAAAEWCGRFHGWGKRARDDPSLAFLVRYDLAYYRAWAARVLVFAAAEGGATPAWLERLCATWSQIAVAFAAVRPTTIHGELGPQNVLWANGKIHPVDWESAAIGPGEIDLAALLFRWPDATVEACLAAYWRARGTNPPSDFAARWNAATLYTALRWIPAPQSCTPAAFAGALAVLERTGQTLGLR